MAASAGTDLSWDERAEEPEPWKAAGWRSAFGQFQRFLAVMRHLQIDPGETVLDWGCGPGDFSEFVPGWATYVGVDSSEAMRERAQRAHPAREFGIPEMVKGEVYDHVVAVGPFNLEPWTPHSALAQIRELWQGTRKTLAVSLLRGDGEYVRHDPLLVTGFARALSQRWLIDASYLPNDLLLVVWR